MSGRFPSIRRLPLVAVGIVGMLTALDGCQSTGTPLPETTGQTLAFVLPPPLAGPGRQPLDPAEHQALENAWSALLAGRPAEVVRTATRWTSPQAALLRIQGELAERPGGDARQQASKLVEDNPDYASAWWTLSVAAELAGDEAAACSAAREAAGLWPGGPLAGRADELEHRFVGERLDRARADLEASRAAEALGEVDNALKVDANNDDALLLRGRALMALDRPDEAVESLSRLGLQPEALLLRAEAASDKGDWQQAMNLLGALPDDNPDKARTLRRAQLYWRLSVLPPYVREATSSRAVTRAQLATVLLAVIPALEVQEGGTTPLMTDIIDLPSQRAILTVTRLDIMGADRVARLFHPERRATADEARRAIEAVCHLMGLKTPLWCEPGTDETGCETLVDPVTGGALLDILLEMEAGTETPS